MAIDRTAYNLLVNDTGDGLSGSVWDKSDVNDLLVAIDAAIAAGDAAEVTARIAGDAAEVTARNAAIAALVLPPPLIFPATMVPSANVNALDEYKEGTWTPVLTFGGAAVGMTYAVQTGRYTRIGRLVVLECSISLSAKGSSVGGATITGIPYALAVAGGTGAIDTSTGFAGLTIPPFVTSSGSTIYPMVTTATSRAQLTEANFTNGTQFTFSISYFA